MLLAPQGPVGPCLVVARVLSPPVKHFVWNASQVRSQYPVPKQTHELMQLGLAYNPNSSTKCSRLQANSSNER